MTAPNEPRETNLGDWPKLDHAAWDETARGWRELGFEPRATWVTGVPKLGVSILQLWERSEEDALVEISQSFLPQRALPVTTMVLSFWGDGAALHEQADELQPVVAPIASPSTVAAPPNSVPASERLPIYSFGTHNRAPNWTWNLLLHPQLLGERLTGATPRTLWEIHLKRCAAMSQVLQQKPLEADLVALSLAEHRVTHALWHRRFQRHFSSQMWRAWRSGTSQTQTWGELETKLRAIHDETREKTDAL